MHSTHSQLIKSSSLDEGKQRLYNFNELLSKLETLCFEANLSGSTTSETAPQSNDNRQFFYKEKKLNTIQQKTILKCLLQIKRIIGKQINQAFDSIQNEIINSKLNVTYLKYLYGVMRIFSIEELYMTRILIWIYSLCYGSYQRQSPILKTIVTQHSKHFVQLGMHILATQNQKIKKKLSQHTDICLKRMQRRFKKAMIEFIKTQQQRNHEEKYEICRICQSHISVNLMHAHLVICQTIYQKNYLEDKIIAVGKELLQKIKQEDVEYDYLDQRADTKLFFNRVYTMLGEKNVVFQAKEDELEMTEVIEQFKHSKDQLIRKTVELLQKYYENVMSKSDPAGYDSDEGLKASQHSAKSKLKSNKYISRNSIRLSSHSLNQDSDSRKSSTGSQKQIRFNEQSIVRTVKTFHTVDDFQIIRLLGKGAYSEVYLVRNINTKDLFAMKVVEVENISGDTLEALRKEQEIYKRISSEFAIQLFYSFADENLHFFILEYANGGNLRHLLEDECYLEQTHAKLYLANLILAIEQIHHMGIIHRDLKPENIVIDQQGFLKLTDFNLALMLTNNQEEEDQNKFFGSPDYIAPEVISSELKHHPSRDVWSLGIIAYEIMIGVTPFTDMDVQAVFQNILSGEIQWPEIGQEEGMISSEAKSFIQALLEPNPYKRLGYNGIGQLKSHQFFKGINWANIRQHHPYFVPKKEIGELVEDPTLKEKINQRRSSCKTPTNFPSLGCIVRYDVLKSKSSLKAKSTRKSRFKMQKQLNELKILTSMDSFPTPHADSQKSLNTSSKSSGSVLQSQQPSNDTIQYNDISYRSIQAACSHKAVIHQQQQQDYQIKISSPQKP